MTNALRHDASLDRSLRSLVRALEGAGWRLLAVEIDGDAMTARIEIGGIDGKLLTLDARNGRASITRELVSTRRMKVGAGGAPHGGGGPGMPVERLEHELIGRTQHEGFRSAMRWLAAYLADNAPATELPRSEARRLLAPLLSGWGDQDRSRDEAHGHHLVRWNVNRDEYEAKIAAKKRRMLERAERRDQQGREAAARAGAIADRIPMGQPILVGHHSERRHRRDLDRIDRNMREASEAAGEAEDLRRRADKVGTTISSEDPDAIDKLEAKLAELEASREEMKAINDTYRRGGWDAVRAKGLMTETQIADSQRMAKLMPGRDVPFRSYAFTNTAGEIARVKKRIAELAEGPPALDPIEGDGWRIEARPELNRVAITFDEKPSAEITTKLKRGGWRWSPRAGAWLRLFNKATLWAVDAAVKYLPAKASASSKDSDRPPPIYETRPTKARKLKSGKAPRSNAQVKRSAKSAASIPRKGAANAKSGASRRKTGTKGAKRAQAPDRPAFSRFITHPTTRARLDARDYGYKAWPLGGSGTSG